LADGEKWCRSELGGVPNAGDSSQQANLSVLYLAAFEMLKDSIIDRLRSFYTSGYDKDGDRIQAEGLEPQPQHALRISVVAGRDWRD
jgi:hypothetical protein